MNQTDMGASDYNTDRCSDSDDTTPTYTSRCFSMVTTHTGITNTGIHSSLVIKLAHDKMWHPIYIKTQLPTLFHIVLFTAIILLVETNPYYEQYLKTNFSST
jgi:hypothetical protein